MSYENILLALDLSQDNDIILKKAKNIVKVNNSKLTIISILPNYLIVANLLGNNVEQELKKTYNQRMQKAIVDLDLIVENYRIITGNPKTDIIKYAKEMRADLIIVGNHNGGNIINNIFIGSSALSVINNANCDVTIIKNI